MYKTDKQSYKNKRLPLLFSLGLFGFPLVATIPVILEIDSVAISVSLRSIVLFLSLLALLPIRKSTFTTQFLLFCVFWLLYSFRILNTYTLSDDIVYYMSNIKFFSFTYGACLIPALAIFNTASKVQQNSDSFFNFTFFILLVATIANLYLSFNLISRLEMHSGRLKTSVLNPITLGNIGTSLILLSMHSLFSNCRKELSWYILFIISIAVGLVAAFSSGSKGPILAFIMVFFIFIMLRLKPKKAISITFLVAIGLNMSIQVIDLLQESFNIYPFKRFEGLLSLLDGKAADQSTSIRVELYTDAWNQFLNSPFFGSGIVEKNSGFYPHNIFIESFMSTGIVGGLIMIILSLLMFIKSIYLVKMQHSLGWVGLIAINSLFSNLFSGSIHSSNIFWLCMAFILSIKAVKIY